jgi:hypothetical protein
LSRLTDDLIRNRAVDDANDVPYRSRHILLLVVQVHYDVLGGRPYVILYTLVFQALVPRPPATKVGGLGAVAIEGLEDG